MLLPTGLRKLFQRALFWICRFVSDTACWSEEPPSCTTSWPAGCSRGRLRPHRSYPLHRIPQLFRGAERSDRHADRRSDQTDHQQLFPLSGRQRLDLLQPQQHQSAVLDHDKISISFQPWRQVSARIPSARYWNNVYFHALLQKVEPRDAC